MAELDHLAHRVYAVLAAVPDLPFEIVRRFQPKD